MYLLSKHTLIGFEMCVLRKLCFFYEVCSIDIHLWFIKKKYSEIITTKVEVIIPLFYQQMKSFWLLFGEFFDRDFCTCVCTKTSFSVVPKSGNRKMIDLGCGMDVLQKVEHSREEGWCHLKATLLMLHNITRRIRFSKANMTRDGF